MTPIAFAVEGQSDIPFAEAILRSVGSEPRTLLIPGGKHLLDQRVKRWNAPSNRLPTLVIRDWDVDDKCDCAGALVTACLGGPALTDSLLVRVACRAIESWALADRDSFCDHFSVRPALVSTHPDSLADPKRELLRVVAKSSRKAVRQAMSPREGSGRQVGPEYVANMAEYAASSWRVSVASRNSPSLERAIQRLVERFASL